MSLSLLGPDMLETIAYLARCVPHGVFIEVGVYKGGTARVMADIANERSVPIHLFDTFTGIPDKGPFDLHHNIGDFGDTSVDAVRQLIPEAIIHQGYFPDTVPRDLFGISFVHVDCDQYSGAMGAINVLWPRMIQGGVMLFDDYECTSGVTKAVNDRFSPNHILKTPQGRAVLLRGWR